MRYLSIMTVLLLAGAIARADVVYLTNGKSIEGRVTVDGEKVTVELPCGTVSFPKSKVLRIERKESSVEAFEKKYKALPEGDTAARLTLAAWCRRGGMGPRSEALLREVLDIDTDNAEARRLLGYVQHDGRWVTPEDRNRQIGLVEFEGQWHKPESVAAIKAARAEAVRAVEERKKAELDLRLREAEIEGLRAERQRLEAERLRLETERAELATERLRMERLFLRYPNFRLVGGSIYFYPNFPDTRQGIIIIRSTKPKDVKADEAKPDAGKTDPKAGTDAKEVPPADQPPADEPTVPGTGAPPS
jgi:hypothetical protein